MKKKRRNGEKGKEGRRKEKKKYTDWEGRNLLHKGNDALYRKP